MSQLENIEAIEKHLWSAADTLRANSNYASNEYFLPVMGLIFLRHAYSRFLAVKEKIETNLPTRGGKARALTKEDFSQKSAIYLRPEAQFDTLVDLTDADDRAKAIITAMESIEDDYASLKGTLPKAEYQELDNEVLGQLLRTLNPEQLKKADGDIFGRIYEYFLTQFANQGAHDGGEFFTPISLVSFIANVLEPERGIVLDPACGSCGMFVQSARIVETRHENPAEKLTFYGSEKNGTTIELAKMNLAVHGLEGKIQRAISYYEDPHELLGKCDYVMANPPFNVDEVDADKVKRDPRLPFGLPGVNKKNKVSNANYLWISYFYSYLNATGRSGFVMSSQSSSAGRDEAIVRQKLIETGAVDIMVAVRSNFFYTRSVPCELWFLDKGKPTPSPPTPLPRGEGGKKSHYRGGYDFSGLVEKARELRKKQTPAEEVLWQVLRNRQVADLKFRRQHQIGDYITDFYCHECKLVIELDGDVHDTATKKKSDAKRQKYLEAQGLTVLRFRNELVLEAPLKVLETIASTAPATAQAQVLPPSPSGRRAGDEGDMPLNHKGHVLMLDARNVYRKVTRKIFDFSPEQLQNLLSIVWLYRGESKRFTELVVSYLQRTLAEASACFEMTNSEGETIRLAATFRQSLNDLREKTAAFLAEQVDQGLHIEAVAQLDEAATLFAQDLEAFQKSAAKETKAANSIRDINAATTQLAPLAETSRDLLKQADLLYKLAIKAIDSMTSPLPLGEGPGVRVWARTFTKCRKDMDAAREALTDQLKRVRHMHKQAVWLTERFPAAKLRDVEGLVKLVDHKEIEANDWSLTPGRYVGVAPEEEDEDFDFEETLRDIHVELKGLNEEASELAAKIQKNFEELGV